MPALFDAILRSFSSISVWTFAPEPPFSDMPVNATSLAGVQECHRLQSIPAVPTALHSRSSAY